MNASINLPQLDQTDQHTKEHRVKIGCRDIIHICAAPISMVLPIIIRLLLKENLIKYNILPKLAIVLPPLLYSGIQCFVVLFNNNREEQCESPSTLNSALHSLTSITLLLFSLISLLSIILSATEKWNQNIRNLLSTLIFPYLVPSTYLLNTSCSLAQSNFQYTTTNTVDILLDLLILLSPASIAIIPIFNFVEKEWILFFIILLPIFTLIRSSREKYFPSAKYNGPTSLWRVATLIIILVLAIIAYGFIGFTSLLILDQEFSDLYET
ncbi:DUF2463 domain-containing protein [Encephalitozoon hellem]|uniref:DUF2463 domain-containing protein n=1 Tax=Encephalitozoon hellem TaxID=27973 RepID=A0ABY8CKT0_ENCHE|nr:DUF2463 domain-containing protein [Encephalitozoon hellem]WEL39382.1 DUF2463 domain-containing protein [Encephalitozoon hellem]